MNGLNPSPFQPLNPCFISVLTQIPLTPLWLLALFCVALTSILTPCLVKALLFFLFVLTPWIAVLTPLRRISNEPWFDPCKILHVLSPWLSASFFRALFHGRYCCFVSFRFIYLFIITFFWITHCARSSSRLINIFLHCNEFVYGLYSSIWKRNVTCSFLNDLKAFNGNYRENISWIRMGTVIKTQWMR